MLESLIAYAVLSYVVVGINWVMADYHPHPAKIAAAFVFWPGWIVGRVRWHFQNAESE